MNVLIYAFYEYVLFESEIPHGDVPFCDAFYVCDCAFFIPFPPFLIKYEAFIPVFKAHFQLLQTNCQTICLPFLFIKLIFYALNF